MHPKKCNRYANLSHDGEQNLGDQLGDHCGRNTLNDDKVDDQVEQSDECQVREDLHYDNSKIPASQSATIPEQPTTSGHDNVQQLPEDKNTESTQKAAPQKPHLEQCSASEHHNPTVNQHNQVGGG